MAKPKGGKRAGSGRPHGSKNVATITKEQSREALRTIVLREMDALVAAQIAHAKGLQYLVSRDKKTGKFVRLTEEMFLKALEAGDDDSNEFAAIEVWQKDPSVQAFTDLMNRALDKPKEQEQELRLAGTLELVAQRLMAARKRLKEQ